MKSYTDLEQSKKLAEFLPLKSADMFYRNNGIEVKLMWEHNAPKVEYPCWSLAALLEYLRKHDLFPEIKDADDYILMDIIFYDGNEVAGKVINPVHFIRAEGKNILDACCELILKLHDKNLI